MDFPLTWCFTFCRILLFNYFKTVVLTVGKKNSVVDLEENDRLLFYPCNLILKKIVILNIPTGESINLGVNHKHNIFSGVPCLCL